MGWVSIKNTVTGEVQLLGDGIGEDAYGKTIFERVLNSAKNRTKAMDNGSDIHVYTEIRRTNS